ncbi:MAG: radical SAM protein [Candidatus Palauibacterales bacterium]|nr:radical SAM protein [Candidatus Palauibacterales bacterium]
MASGGLPVVDEQDARPEGAGAPEVELEHLDTLWFQVTGTICNLECSHCFISCSPDNHTLEFLDLETVLDWVERSGEWGVKEFYVTGGEPFMHRDLAAMLEAMLQRGPASVLTNGTLMREKTLRRLATAHEESRYSLEIRVSIDGPNPEMNDPIRGEGTFERAMEGVRKLLDHGFLPIVTATQVWDQEEDEAVRREFMENLRAQGYENPRLKILPSIKTGREAARSRGYGEGERVTAAMMEGYEEEQLICSSARIVTSEGVHVCPILVDEPDSLMGQTMEEADEPFELKHQACYTCWLHGAICSNYGGIGEEVT